MQRITVFFKEIYDLNALLLFLIASFFLLINDYRFFKEKGYKREAKFARSSGYVYIALGLGLYIVSLIFKG